MKKFFSDIHNYDAYLTIIIALLLGMFAGVFFQTKYSLGIKTFFHNVYIKLNPDSQKDSKTLILERVTKDTPNLPQKDIFEEPEKKDNPFVLYIKRIFINKNEKTHTIHDIVIN